MTPTSVSGPQGNAAVTVEFDVEMAAGDGTVLSANVYRPAAEGTWPALVLRTPYGKDGQQPAIHLVDPIRAARAGFVVVVQDCRGRFASGGEEWRPYEAEAEDGAAAVAWVAAMECTNGRVGLYGASYHGTAALAAESAAPPALGALAVKCCWFDQRNGQTFRGGALELGKMSRWTLMNLPDKLRRREGLPPGSWSAAMAAADAEMDALATGGYTSLPLATFEPIRRHDPRSEVLDYVAAGADAPSPVPPLRVGTRGVRVPTLWIGGWFDAFLGDTVAGFQQCQAEGVPAELLVGPWTHAQRARRIAGLDFGPDAEFVGPGRLDFEGYVLDWFRAWLAPPADAPPATAARSAGPAVRTFCMGANRWEAGSTWPPEGTRQMRLYLGPGGDLSEEAPASPSTRGFTYDPARPAPTVGGATIMGPPYTAGPLDQAPLTERDDLLAYLSAPLAEPLVVSGPVAVELFVVTDVVDTDFVARLVDAAPTGEQWLLTDGIVRARYKEGGPRALVEPGTAFRCVVDLWSTSYEFAPGHRVGLHVTSSSFPRWDRNLNTADTPGTGVQMEVAHQQVCQGPNHPSSVVLTVRR